MRNEGGESADCGDIEKKRTKQGILEEGDPSSQEGSVDKEGPGVVTVVICSGEARNQLSDLKGRDVSKDAELEKVDSESPKKFAFPRSESSHEQCRVCQQETDEALVELGCQCRGGLAKAHRSCIDLWFRTRGSNKCEICQQVAANVPCPEPQPSTNYWVWRVGPALRGSNFVQGESREEACNSPLWIAFSILIGGLLLDVLISISLGVSVLPINIIIGVLVVLGLGTALRLALDCCHEWSLRRVVQRVDANIISGYHPTV